MTDISTVFDPSAVILTLEAQVKSLTAERDEWCIVVGKIVATIPVRDVLGASATLGDTIKYLEDLHAERDALLKRTETAETKIRSDAISEFSKSAGLLGSEQVKALPADVKMFRANSAYRATGEQP